MKSQQMQMFSRRPKFLHAEVCGDKKIFTGKNLKNIFLNFFLKKCLSHNDIHFVAKN